MNNTTYQDEQGKPRARWSRFSPEARRDFFVILTACVICYGVAVAFELFDNFIHLLAAHEEWELDEIIAALLLSSFAIFGFAWRRLSESSRELKARLEAEERARALAMHDALTGLPNRKMLRDYLEPELSRGARTESIAIVAIDLDRFKPINDLYGHAAGDKVLVALSRAFQDELTHDEMAARLGGDEFIIVLRNIASESELMSRVTRLAHIFDVRICVGSATVQVGATMGVAVVANETVSFDEALRRADVALYRCKDKAKGLFAFHDEAMDSHVEARLALERSVREAVASQRIEPFFQPLVDLESGEVYGYEVLARMRMSDGGIAPPSEFITLAEEIGIIDEMTLDLLGRACIQMRDWPGAPLLSVNVSPVQLRDPALAQKILQALSKVGFPPGRLQIEITENALVADIEQASKILTSLRNQGVRIALDDFGTGYSSLRHLRELPFDNLKIDQSFVHAMDESEDSLAIIQTIVDLARNLDIAVTAEGIEEQEAAARLKALGCANGQGYLYGRPKPASDIAEKDVKAADIQVEQGEEAAPSEVALRQRAHR